MNSLELSLDLSKETRVQQPIRIRQGDLEGTTIVARIYDGGVAAETTGLAAYVVMELPDREHYYRKQAALSGNVATVTVDEAEAASVTGMTDNAYFQLIGEGVIYSTSRFTVTVLKGAIDGHDTAETYDGYVEDWLEGMTSSIGSTMSNAITAMNNAAGAAISDANAAASAASAAATDAEGRIEAAIEAAGDISELAVPLMCADTRGGAKLGDGLAVDDGTLHVG